MAKNDIKINDKVKFIFLGEERTGTVIDLDEHGFKIKDNNKEIIYPNMKTIKPKNTYGYIIKKL